MIKTIIETENQGNKLVSLVEKLRKKFDLEQVIYISGNGNGSFNYTADILFPKNVTLKYSLDSQYIFKTGASTPQLNIWAVTHEKISLFGNQKRISEVEEEIRKEILRANSNMAISLQSSTSAQNTACKNSLSQSFLLQ